MLLDWADLFAKDFIENDKVSFVDKTLLITYKCLSSVETIVTHRENMGEIKYRHDFTTWLINYIFKVPIKYYLQSIKNILAFGLPLMLSPCKMI